MAAAVSKRTCCVQELSRGFRLSVPTRAAIATLDMSTAAREGATACRDRCDLYPES